MTICRIRDHKPATRIRDASRCGHAKNATRFTDKRIRGLALAALSARSLHVSVCFCRRRAMSEQAGAVDGLLHQSRGIGLFDKFTEVAQACGLTFCHRSEEHTSELQSRFGIS